MKVAGGSNPADLFTKHLGSRAKLDQLIALFHCKFPEGRPATAPALRRAGASKKQEADANQAASEHILPHVRTPEEILKMFPAAVAYDAWISLRNSPGGTHVDPATPPTGRTQPQHSFVACQDSTPHSPPPPRPKPHPPRDVGRGRATEHAMII